MLIFQSTLPRRERPLLLILLRDGEHFNPRSHEGSDCTNSVPFFVYLCISIHAPTKGATLPHLLQARSYYFNPRSRERSDVLTVFLTTLQLISIHAPARGATSDSLIPVPLNTRFQSTLPREERRIGFVMLIGSLVFQSTLPREERRLTHSSMSFCLRFQSTLPREERRYLR